MIAPLEAPDCHYLSAAEGWLELGDHAQAAVELQLIAQEWCAHPAVLELNWQIHARTGRWEECLKLASEMVHLTPELSVGWIHRSFALHELKRTREARDQLLPAVLQFPNEAILTYNLACYECCLGNLPVAREWLKKTFAPADAFAWRLTALQDADLERLWPEIETL